MSSTDPFDPSSTYTPPKADGGNYLKFGPGQTEFLALTSPVIGWLYWNTDKKPVRLTEEPKGDLSQLPGIRAEDDGKYKVNHFWAFPVIDGADGKVKMLEITQKGIMNDIRAYIKNERWGTPVMKYTFTVAKAGEGLDTKYTVMANPLVQGVPAAWMQAWKDVVDFGFNLNELFMGGDPFKPSTPALVNPAAAAAAPQVQPAAPAVDTATPPN
jgi:hypothetical protein